MKALKQILPFVVLTILMTCCKEQNADSTSVENPFSIENEVSMPEITILRMDTIVENFDKMSESERKIVMEQNKDILWGYSNLIGTGDTISEKLILNWTLSPATKMFMPEVKQTFQDVITEQKAISRIMATAKKNDLKFPIEKFVTVTWGNKDRSIVIADTIKTAYIALNHYLGPNSKVYQGWPDYKKNIKARAMLPVDLSEAMIATTYPFRSDKDMTVLSRMLYEGAVLVAKEAMNPQATPAQLFGYTDNVFNQIKDHEEFIWNHLVSTKEGGNALLYSTDGEIMSNLFDFLPASTRISPDAPGRAVRYVGYRIVKEYMAKNDGSSLKELLSPQFYGNAVDVLRKSSYAPASK